MFLNHNAIFAYRYEIFSTRVILLKSIKNYATEKLPFAIIFNDFQRSTPVWTNDPEGCCERRKRTTIARCNHQG
jgi:hypothetical protein